MSWLYEQLTGNFIDPIDVLQGKGYSGQPPYKNVPTAENLANLGPIPTGTYMATGVELSDPKLGPYVIVLDPDANTTAKIISYGRIPSTFRIHGERIEPPPGYASDGCIIQSRDVRELFWNSNDHEIVVVVGGD